MKLNEILRLFVNAMNNHNILFFFNKISISTQIMTITPQIIINPCAVVASGTHFELTFMP